MNTLPPPPPPQPFQLGRYSKTIAAIVTAIGVTASALADQALTEAEIAALAVAWVGVFTVYQATNKR